MQYAPWRRSRWTAVVPIAVLGAFILGSAATAYGSSALAGPAPAARATVVTGVVGHNDRTSVVSPRHPSGLGRHGDKPKPTDPGPADPASPDPVDSDPANPDPTTPDPEPSGPPTIPAPEPTSSPDDADDPATSGPSARPTATPADRPSTRSKDARSPATPRTPRPAAPAVLLRPGQAPPLPEVTGPDRVPTGGSEPYADPTPPPPPPEPPTQSIGSLLAGTGTGSKIFVAGLAGLVIAVVGLVTVVVRRRQW